MSKSSSKSATQIFQVISYSLLEICHEDNNCNREWNHNNDDSHGFSHLINNNNRKFVNNNKNSCNNNTTTATDSVTDQSCTQSTAPEGDPQRIQAQSTNSSLSPTSINETYNCIHHINRSSTESTQLHYLIFNNSNAPLITTNPVSTSSNNNNIKNHCLVIISSDVDCDDIENNLVFSTAAQGGSINYCDHEHRNHFDDIIVIIRQENNSDFANFCIDLIVEKL